MYINSMEKDKQVTITLSPEEVIQIHNALYLDVKDLSEKNSLLLNQYNNLFKKWSGVVTLITSGKFMADEEVVKSISDEWKKLMYDENEITAINNINNS